MIDIAPIQLKNSSITVRPAPAQAPRRERARGPLWLNDALERLWADYFWDVPRVSPVSIRFGSRWKNRLGLIRWEPETESSLILMNGYFRDPRVPGVVCVATIAHELIHYAHGFGSALPRYHADPHADDLIGREMRARGLDHLLVLADNWIDENWQSFCATTNLRPT